MAMPGRLGQLGARLHADAHHHEVAGHVRPSLVRTRSTASVALERLDAGPQQQPHAVIGVDVAVDRADLGPEHPFQRHRGGSTTVTSQTALARRGRDLGADPAGADHDDAPPRSSRSRSASESSTVRRKSTPSRSAPGIVSRRGSAPVASSRRS